MHNLSRWKGKKYVHFEPCTFKMLTNNYVLLWAECAADVKWTPFWRLSCGQNEPIFSFRMQARLLINRIENLDMLSLSLSRQCYIAQGYQHGTSWKYNVKQVLLNTYVISFGGFFIICSFISTFLAFLTAFLCSGWREDIFEWVGWLERNNEYMKIMKWLQFLVCYNEV